MRKRIGANRRRKITGKRQIRPAGKKGASVVKAALLFILAIICAAGLALLYVKGREKIRTTPWLTVKTISFRGNRRAGQDDLFALAGLHAGMHLSEVKPDAVRKALSRNHWIKSVSVRRLFPGTVIVSINEREPVALVNVGAVFLMDAEGILLPMVPETGPALPLVSGLRDTLDENGRRRIRSADLTVFNEFCDAARKVNSRWFGRISQLDFSCNDRVGITIEGQPVFVKVSREDVPRRMRRLWHLIETTGAAGNEGGTIDLCYRDLAFVRQ